MIQQDPSLITSQIFYGRNVFHMIFLWLLYMAYIYGMIVREKCRVIHLWKFFFSRWINLHIFQSIMGVSIRFFIPLLSKKMSNILWHQLYYSLKFSFCKLQLLQKNAKNFQRGGIWCKRVRYEVLLQISNWQQQIRKQFV